MTVLGFKPWQKHPREPWKSQRWVLEPQNGQFYRSASSQIPTTDTIRTNTILVSILEWINCGTDTAETSPDNSMDNSTEEEDQV